MLSNSMARYCSPAHHFRSNQEAVKATAIAFGPGTQITLPTSGLNAPASVTVDALGDVFHPGQLQQPGRGLTGKGCK